MGSSTTETSSKKKNLFLILFTVLASILVMELIFRWAFPLPDPYSGMRRSEHSAYIPRRHTPGFDLRAQMEPGLPGMSGVSRFTINANGFRGDDIALGKVTNEFRIFLVGGSTTECVVIDNDKSPHTKIQKRLSESSTDIQFKVLNAGHSGDASYDYISVIAHRLVHYSPDVITVMPGINDLIAAIRDRDYLHVHAHSSINYDNFTLLKMLLTQSQIYRRLWSLRRPIQAKISSTLAQNKPVTTVYQSTSAKCLGRSQTEDRPRKALDAYRRNLLTLIGIARQHEVALIFMTQPHSWNSEDPQAKNWHWMNCQNGVRYREDFMAEALKSYNDVTRDVAKSQGIQLIDLAEQMPASLDFVYDDVHFNQKGSDTMAESIAQTIQKMRLPPSAP